MVYGVAQSAPIVPVPKDMSTNTLRRNMFIMEDIFVQYVVNCLSPEPLWECTPTIIIQLWNKVLSLLQVLQPIIENTCYLLYNILFPHNCIISYHSFIWFDSGSMTSHEIDALIKMKIVKKESTFSCTDCEYTSQLKCNIEKHVEAQHIRPGVFCQYCSKVCPTRHALRMHLKRNHNTIPLLK